MSNAQDNRAAKKLAIAVAKEGWTLKVHNDDQGVGYSIIAKAGDVEVIESITLICGYLKNGKPTLKQLIELVKAGPI